MFDDLKQDNNQNVSSPIAQTNSEGVSPAPQNTPSPRASGVDDMFGDVDPVATLNGPVDPNKPSAVQLGKIRPISQTTVPTPAPSVPNMPPQKLSMPSMNNDDSMLVTDSASSGLMRKIVVALLVVVLLALTGGGIYYFFLRGNNINLDSNENTEINTNIIVNEKTNENTEANTNTEPAINEDDLDDDFDGLSNGLEKIYGTNPLESDTDNDGVFDQDEVELYHTDPLIDDSDNDGLSDHEEIIIYTTDPNNPDTDGDTYQDGSEVLNGYSPLGNGKLEANPGPGNLNTNENL